MSVYKEKLDELIGSSDLEDNEKKLWNIFIKLAESPEDEAVYEAVSAGPDNLHLLTNHLMDKIWSMKQGRDSLRGIARDQGELAGSL